jgi:hypothetical protein
MTTLSTVLLIWAGVLAVLVSALALATRQRRSRPREFAPRGATADDRRHTAASDRRRGDPYRRMGLPDLRPHQVERRSRRGDRRGGARDRRVPLGSV